MNVSYLNFLSRLIMPLAALLSVTGCRLHTPARKNADYSQYKYSFDGNGAEQDLAFKWWLHFKSDDLNALMNEAIDGNLDLQTFQTRVEKAASLARQAGASLQPQLNYSAGASSTRQQLDDGNFRNRVTTERYSIGLAGSYEVDLWGKLEAARKSAAIEVEASEEDLQAAIMTLAGNISQNWLRLKAETIKIALLKKQLKINENFLMLMELRFKNSQASALDVLQQKELVEEVKSQIPLSESNRQLYFNTLAALCGKVPAELKLEVDESLPVYPPRPEIGLPAIMLAMRPDVRAVLKRLESKAWQITEAKTDKLPSLPLTVGAGFDSGKFDLIFDNWYTSLAASLTGSILDGDRREAKIDQKKAELAELTVNYKKSVINAIVEVENAFVSEKKLVEHVASLERQNVLLKKTVKQARFRYKNGLSDYLPVLNEQLKLQTLERALVEANKNLLIQRTNLYRSLGGSWNNQLYEQFKQSVTKVEKGNE